MSRAAQVYIDLQALKHNLRCVRNFAPGRSVLAMVKADAYGHGIERVAMALQDADALGVSCIEEALRIRAAGIKKRIVLMEGFFDSSEIALIMQHQLDVVIHQFSQIELLEKTSLFYPLHVWLKVDSGMHRLGFLPHEVPIAWQRLNACPWINPEPILVTHFACADQVHHPKTLEQLRVFNQVVADLPGQRCLANSAAILAWPDTLGDWVRPGLVLYGVSPFPHKMASDFGLKPAMTISSELIAVKHLAKGATVGYGGTWVCPEDMPVGIVAMGYGDGYPRQAVNGTPVLVNNQQVPLIGRVAMDMLNVDLRTQPQAKIGDPVILWGEGLPIEIVAQHADVASYELLCGITQRMRQADNLSDSEFYERRLA